MSHHKLRKDKTCLNCGQEVPERFCTKCGQENVEPKESAWQLIVHFFNDVTHFDGKFFSSMKYLLFFPGFLTKEYVIGHRARHLNPIRMYLFISAMFFLLYANSLISNKTSSSKAHDTAQVKKGHKLKNAGSNLKKLGMAIDSLGGEGDNDLVILANGDSIARREIYHFTPHTVSAYDSFQRLLPREEQEYKFLSNISRKMIQFNSYKGEDKKEFNHRLLAYFFHSIPYMLFFALPILALLLKLLYVRRKEFYYVSHGIFIVHYVCFVFIALLLDKFVAPLGIVGGTLGTLIQISTLVYLYAAMYNFYRQGWFKTLVKFLLFYIIGGVLLVLFFFGFILNAILHTA